MDVEISILEEGTITLSRNIALHGAVSLEKGDVGRRVRSVLQTHCLKFYDLLTVHLDTYV
jgi:hypothetical protein